MQENNNINVTVEEFLTMNEKKKGYLAQNTSITPEVQKLFFTLEYDGKYWILRYLARNTSITPDVQMMFFTQEYDEKYWTLRHLIGSTGFPNNDISFTEMSDKDWIQLVLDYGYIRGTLKLVPNRIKKLPEYKATRILSMIAVNR